ncbi:MAG TPA: YceI family protein [Gemmatimonadales bacterium]|jgi:polyisoprenoid-binding protein YceI|nr:YceI family protein [Gemmatimonadales bacterium]
MFKQWMLGLGLPAVLMAAIPAAGPTIRFEVASTGNEVRYRVTEQLAGFDLPNDAVGKTGAVTGAVELDSAGRVVAADSRITATVSGLASDRSRRDGYVRGRILETDSFPTVTLQPTAIQGLPWPLPATGSASFTLAGNLTVKGVTRPSSWTVMAAFRGDTVSGQASTAFTFADFGLDRPRVPIVLSVGDTIRLEYDFTLVR